MEPFYEQRFGQEAIRLGLLEEATLGAFLGGSSHAAIGRRLVEAGHLTEEEVVALYEGLRRRRKDGGVADPGACWVCGAPASATPDCPRCGAPAAESQATRIVTPEGARVSGDSTVPDRCKGTLRRETRIPSSVA